MKSIKLSIFSLSLLLRSFLCLMGGIGDPQLLFQVQLSLLPRKEPKRRHCLSAHLQSDVQEILVSAQEKRSPCYTCSLVTVCSALLLMVYTDR